MPAINRFLAETNDTTAPLTTPEVVTPNDGIDLTSVSRAVYVGGAGDLRVTMLGQDDGASVTVAAAGVGWHPIRVKRVWATGTTATNIVAFD